MASPIAGASATARTGARHNPSSTPASMALASGAGIAATARPSGFHSPATTISAPVSRKAPTATGKPPSGMAEEASSAAPGVDQATLIGIRRQALSSDAAEPHGDGQRHQPGCGLGRAGAHRPQSLQHHREGGGEADEPRQQPGRQGGQRHAALHAVQPISAGSMSSPRPGPSGTATKPPCGISAG